MGYRIQNYSLSELNRISLPGSITPSIFWLIPIGKWSGDNLEYFWQHFTEKKNSCNNYGVMLAKAGSSNNNNPYGGNIDLTGLTGQLNDLLPGGNRKHYDDLKIESSGSKNEPKIENVLILSASYPQPGWGVLLSISEPKQLEDLLNNVIEQSPHPNFIETRTVLDKFDQAASAFNEFEIKKKLKPRVTKPKKNSEIENITEVNRFIDEYLSENHLGLSLKRAIDGVSWDLFPDNLKALAESLNLLITDKYILANNLYWLRKTRDPQVLQNIFTELANLPNNPSDFFNNLRDEDIKTAAGLIHRFRHQFAIPNNNYIEWAEEYYESNKEGFKCKILKLSEKIDQEIGSSGRIEEEIDKQFKVKEKEWNKEFEILRIAKQRALIDAVKAQWDFGPKFLYNMELYAMKMGYNPVSIAWDQPRMIGWKIFCNNIEIPVGDIKGNFIDEFQHVMTNGDEIEETRINGSYFTDYVHFLTIANHDRNPRSTTLEILKKVFPFTAMKKVLRTYGRLEIEDLGIDKLSEELIKAFGWPKKENEIEDTMASCIIEVDGNITINRRYNGNQYRNIFESYCKDLLNTVTSKLGIPEIELWELIKNNSVFRRDDRLNWNETVKNVTIGSAVILLNTILPIAIPDNEENSKNLIKNLKEVEFLNKFSHHNPNFTEAKKEKCFIDLLGIIPNVLKISHDLISEMPWHITVTQKYGNSPLVLTGNGWSHSHIAPRLLRVILLEEPQSSNVVIWNPSKVNPVISDGMLITT